MKDFNLRLSSSVLRPNTGITLATKTLKQTESQSKPEQPEQASEPVDETVADKTAKEEVSTPALGWLTVEMLLYGLIILLGVILRLWDLSAYPLSDVEARQALVSLALYQGATPEAAGSYSPLLTTLNTFLFFLLTDSDTTARHGSSHPSTAETCWHL